MLSRLANDFNEIHQALAENEALRNSVIELISSESIHGKVVEEGDRLTKFKELLISYVNGHVILSELYVLIEEAIPRRESIYSVNNKVFANGWAERLARVQISRFYNQAVLKAMIAQGHQECFIPHSSNEVGNSPCSQHLAGANHNVQILYDRLINSYSLGNYDKELKIPNHPHCTHVVIPLTIQNGTKTKY